MRLSKLFRQSSILGQCRCRRLRSNLSRYRTGELYRRSDEPVSTDSAFSGASTSPLSKEAADASQVSARSLKRALDRAPLRCGSKFTFDAADAVGLRLCRVLVKPSQDCPR